MASKARTTNHTSAPRATVPYTDVAWCGKGFRPVSLTCGQGELRTIRVDRTFDVASHDTNRNTSVNTYRHHSKKFSSSKWIFSVWLRAQMLALHTRAILLTFLSSICTQSNNIAPCTITLKSKLHQGTPTQNNKHILRTRQQRVKLRAWSLLGKRSAFVKLL